MLQEFCNLVKLFYFTFIAVVQQRCNKIKEEFILSQFYRSCADALK